jgi:hypothetical protein
MLDLSYNPIANYYEAPLHVKALGGCFIIDDFGRQLVTPAHLLNRRGSSTTPLTICASRAPTAR